MAEYKALAPWGRSGSTFLDTLALWERSGPTFFDILALSGRSGNTFLDILALCERLRSLFPRPFRVVSRAQGALFSYFPVHFVEFCAARGVRRRSDSKEGLG